LTFTAKTLLSAATVYYVYYIERQESHCGLVTLYFALEYSTIYCNLLAVNFGNCLHEPPDAFHKNPKQLKSTDMLDEVFEIVGNFLCTN
jgi:hypothetical protein